MLSIQYVIVVLLVQQTVQCMMCVEPFFGVFVRQLLHYYFEKNQN